MARRLSRPCLDSHTHTQRCGYAREKEPRNRRADDREEEEEAAAAARGNYIVNTPAAPRERKRVDREKGQRRGERELPSHFPIDRLYVCFRFLPLAFLVSVAMRLRRRYIAGDKREKRQGHERAKKSARVERYRARGRNAFLAHQIPLSFSLSLPRVMGMKRDVDR